MLYSFRRCPYAIRARLALALAGVSYDISEVDLKNKPELFLQLSPKGTVPVLLQADGQLLEQSLDIMLWALQQSDPERVLPDTEAQMAISQALITQNDEAFKQALDRYKYPNRYPLLPAIEHQIQAAHWILQWNAALSDSGYFLGSRPSLADYALMPFVRQFAAVDQEYFMTLPANNIQAWLAKLVQSDVFELVMRKL